MRCLSRFAHLLGLVIALCLEFPALGGVQVVRPDARLAIASEELPEALARGEWSLLVWIYSPEEVREPSTLLSIGGRLDVRADSAGLDVWVTHLSHRARLRVDSALQAGRWHLLAISADGRARRASVWLGTQGAGPAGGVLVEDRGRMLRIGSDPGLEAAVPVASDPVLEPSAMGSRLNLMERREPAVRPGLSVDRDGLVVGKFEPGLPAARVVYQALAIRDHAINGADVAGVWQSRWVYAGHSLDATADGGRMNGWRGCVFLTFHAMSPDPHGPGFVEHKASYVGGPVLAGNVIIVDRPVELVSSRSASFLIVHPAREARGMVYRSRLEAELDGFFAIDPAPFAAPESPVGPIGDKAAMLVRGPQGLVRVMVSANSRGVRGTLGPQPWPENFAHGFVQELLPQTAGVMMRPSAILDNRGGWFGMDTSVSSPDTTLVRPLHARSDAWADWTRFGSGTIPGASRGPGPATSISPNGVYRLRCGPVDGSLLVAGEPMVFRSTVLAFPGSSDLVWEPERGVLQHGPGLPVGDVQTLPLDTTRVVHALGAQDVFLNDRDLLIVGMLDVRVGDAMVVMDGPAWGAVSMVSAVNFAGGTTLVSLSHPLGVQPVEGSELRFGSWRFIAVDHRFEGVPAGDDRTWRGQVLRAADDDKLGVMLYAASAWRPDVDGFIFGSAGQSGTGYTPQLDSTFPGALAAWVEHAEVDVWIQGLAQQRSQPSAMWDYLDVLRDGLGADAEVVWASDAVHAHTTHSAWHQFVRDSAAAAGVAAIFAVGEPRLGSFFEQAASGMRTDDAHYSSFGSRVIAQAWLEQIRELAVGYCDIADYDGDGEVSVFDLLAFQTDWEARLPRADLDGDGQFLIFDFLVLLTATDNCP